MGHHTTAWRWCDVDSDGLGATVEYFNGYCVLNAYTSDVAQQAQTWALALGQLGARGVYLKRRVREDLRRQPIHVLAPPQPIWGQAVPERWLVDEHGNFTRPIVDSLGVWIAHDVMAYAHFLEGSETPHGRHTAPDAGTSQ